MLVGWTEFDNVLIYLLTLLGGGGGGVEEHGLAGHGLGAHGLLWVQWAVIWCSGRREVMKDSKETWGKQNKQS